MVLKVRIKAVLVIAPLDGSPAEEAGREDVGAHNYNEPVFSEEMIPAKAKISNIPAKKASAVKVAESVDEEEEREAPTGPVFVRVDKFEQAMKEFGMIKKKANEIESVLKRIIDAKAREENEMRAWMDELQEMKRKLGEIDDSIFSNYGE